MATNRRIGRDRNVDWVPQSKWLVSMEMDDAIRRIPAGAAAA
jgi:hypothetical protein